MGILDLLVTQGSLYSYGDGATPPTNLGATQQSVLHADGNLPGYSLDGSDFATVNDAYQQYNDGYGNSLPMPSLLDLNGQQPPAYTQTGPAGGHY